MTTRQRKRLVPRRPHKPGGTRWSPFLGWHRHLDGVCESGIAYCSSRQRGRRSHLAPIPF